MKILMFLSGEKPWCFVSYIRNPAHPTQNCYSDVRWSATYGSFYSSEACIRQTRENQARTQAQTLVKPVKKQLYNQDSRSAVDNNKVPVINNFDNIAKNQLESEKIPTPPTEPPPPAPPGF